MRRPVKPQPSDAFVAFRELDAELWLASRLKSHGVEIFDGDTTREVRAERARAAILERKLAAVVLGNYHGKLENYELAFARIYNQPLVAKAPRAKHSRTETTGAT
jgi:hypothetical protein